MWWKKLRFSSVPILRHLSLLKICNHDINDTYQLLIHIKLWYTSSKASSHWNYSYNLKLYSICGRKNNTRYSSSQRCSCTNPQILWIFYFKWQRKLCRCNQMKDLEMARLSQIIQVGPMCFYRRKAEGSKSAQIRQQMQKVN